MKESENKVVTPFMAPAELKARQAKALTGLDMGDMLHALRQQRIDQVRADEAGTASNQNAACVRHGDSNDPVGSAAPSARRAV